MNENKFSLYACNHAKPFKTRHFTQSQATKKIAIDAEISRQRGKAKQCKPSFGAYKIMPYGSNEGKSRVESSKGKQAINGLGMNRIAREARPRE